MDAAISMQVVSVTPAVGAIVEGVDLRRPLAPDLVAGIRRALLDHGVIFFRGQDLSTAQMRAFVSGFGRPYIEQFAGKAEGEPISNANLEPTKHATAVWHSDTSFVAEPPMATALRAVRLPRVGGDTCWASMYAAYEALSAPMQRMLDGLSAIHSTVPTTRRLPALTASFEVSARTHGPEAAHPVVRVHPETGRKALFVSECSTTRIVELGEAESDHVLGLLFEHSKSPEFCMRWRWEPNDLAFWDNRSMLHYAVPDYDEVRVMQRVALAGDRPFGP